MSTAFRNTLKGQNAYERHLDWLKVYENSYGGPGKNRAPSIKSKTELDVLKEHHQFIRTQDQDGQTQESAEDLSWEDRLASKLYNSLFREFALVDLKKYKTGGIALRWRTTSEVLSYIGQQTCASLRCPYHTPDPALQSKFEEDPEGWGEEEPLVQTKLGKWEVPFGYEEKVWGWRRRDRVNGDGGDGAEKKERVVIGMEKKRAMVKLVLCKRCGKKLNYKKEKEKKEKVFGDRKLELADVSDEEGGDLGSDDEAQDPGTLERDDIARRKRGPNELSRFEPPGEEIPNKRQKKNLNDGHSYSHSHPHNLPPISQSPPRGSRAPPDHDYSERDDGQERYPREPPEGIDRNKARDMDYKARRNGSSHSSELDRHHHHNHERHSHRKHRPSLNRSNPEYEGRRREREER